VENFPAARDGCEAILHFGGLGHAFWICGKDEARVREYPGLMPAFRMVANVPVPHGVMKDAVAKE